MICMNLFPTDDLYDTYDLFPTDDMYDLHDLFPRDDLALFSGQIYPLIWYDLRSAINTEGTYPGGKE